MALSILIIDDSGFSRKMIIKMLPSSGQFDIREASGGLEGISLYGERRPDLVFLDLTMPGIDGFETLSRIKKLDPDAKVIVVTADIQSGSKEKAIKLGALDVMYKPPSAETLNEAIKRFIL